MHSLGRSYSCCFDKADTPVISGCENWNMYRVYGNVHREATKDSLTCASDSLSEGTDGVDKR